MATTSGAVRFFQVASLATVSATVLVMPGCDEKFDSSVAKVNLSGKTFRLEIAADDDKRFLGLGKREHIEEDGGMLFVFPNAQTREFVMRDCPIDIDIIFLDSAGRVLSMYAMKKEEPRKLPEEAADANGMNEKYDARLKRYSSRYPTQFVIELKGGMLQSLSVKEGELIKLHVDELKRIAK